MKADTLANKINEMIRATKQGHLKWIVEIHTTDGNPVEEKPQVTEEGKEWIVDECFSSFTCNFQRQDYCFITYEIVKTCGEQVKSNNLLFMPPISQRVFDLNILIAHAVDMNQKLANALHDLYAAIIEQREAGNSDIIMKVTDGK